jgi:hypothetical protein
MSILPSTKFDGFIKSPSAAFGFNFAVAARLASGAFYETIRFGDFL